MAKGSNASTSTNSTGSSTSLTSAVANTGTSDNAIGDASNNSTRHRAAASSAYAAPVIPTANCSVGGSFGVQGMSFGLSGAAATIDQTCETIEQAKAASSLGQPAVAQEILCNLPKIREARKRTGNPCWADTPAGMAESKAQEPTDPYVRRRLGPGRNELR